MHPSALLLILVAAGIAGVRGGYPAAGGAPGTLAARFWEEVLPDVPMPEAIADLVKEGIAHSPLNNEHYSAAAYNTSLGGPLRYVCGFNVIPPPGLFFYESLVRVGSTMTVYFPPATVPAILPRDIAEKLPLKQTLAMFNVTPASSVDETLRRCQQAPVAGEQKACTTSLEDTVLAAVRMLGTTTQGVWAAASGLPRAGLPRQRYMVRDVTRLDGDHHVGCHDEAFPYYALFHCHVTAKKPTRAYLISIQGLDDGGPQVAMAAICHRDTSDWSPAHPAFKILHSQPGGEPVCHFLPYANLVFGQKAANDDDVM